MVNVGYALFCHMPTVIIYHNDFREERQRRIIITIVIYCIYCLMRTLFFCRYEPETNELINEELGIAYPITDGIPNMIPQEARLLQKDSNTSTAPAQE